MPNRAIEMYLSQNGISSAKSVNIKTYLHSHDIFDIEKNNHLQHAAIKSTELEVNLHNEKTK